MDMLNMPTECVFLIITDLHWNEKNFRGRKDYSKETKHSLDQLISTAQKYRAQGVTPYGLFLGDIYHHSYNVVFEGIRANNTMIALRSVLEDIFVVMGNHEFSYYSNNPFWTLLTHLESNNVKKMVGRTIQPQGVFHTVNVVDELVVGDVRFIFNHHGANLIEPVKDGKTNIGLFHQDLYSKVMVEDVRNVHGVNMFEHTPTYFDNSGKLNGYHYAFLGHMHLFYGVYDFVCPRTDWSTVLYYLSTLGRTNHLEVVDTMLERNIPAVRVRDGKFVGVEDNKFKLLNRSDCIIEEVVLSAQKARQELKVRKEERVYVQNSDRPMENLIISLSGRPLTQSAAKEIMLKGTSTLHDHFNKEWEDNIWKLGT